MRTIFLIALLPSAPAFADGREETGTLLSLDGVGSALIILFGAIYAVGIVRLWRSAGFGRGVRPWQAVTFAAGWSALAVAMLSPLHEWGEQLLAAHMIEHEILMAVAAPLIAIARPMPALVWGLPRSLRGTGRLGSLPVIRPVWRFLQDPLVATVLHAIAIWAWHAPVLFDAAVENEAVHWLQHISFFGTALLFWSVLIHANTRRGLAVAHLFGTSMHMGALGALMALSRYAWYVGNSEGAAALGLTPLQDQQLAGLIMWVPAGTIYAGAALAFAALWIRESSTGAPRYVAAPR